MSGNERSKILDIHDVLTQHDRWIHPEVELVFQLREVLTPLVSSAATLKTIQQVGDMFQTIESITKMLTGSDGRGTPIKTKRVRMSVEENAVHTKYNKVSKAGTEWCEVRVRRAKVLVIGEDNVILN